MTEYLPSEARRRSTSGRARVACMRCQSRRENGSGWPLAGAHQHGRPAQGILRRDPRGGSGQTECRAARLGLVPRNVCTLVDAPRMAERELRVLDRDQVRELLDVARGDRLEALYVLAVTTGMRQGELLALRWRDVDLAHGTLQVRTTLQYTKDRGYFLGAPKTKQSRSMTSCSPTPSASPWTA